MNRRRHVELVSMTLCYGGHKVVNPVDLSCPACGRPLDFRIWSELIELRPAEVESPCAHG